MRPVNQEMRQEMSQEMRPVCFLHTEYLIETRNGCQFYYS